MDLKELESGVDPRVHWYYQTKKIPLINYFGRLTASAVSEQIINVADIGAGSGFFSLALQEKYVASIRQVWLVDSGYTDQEIVATRGYNFQKTHVLPEGFENGFLMMMDVLEHVEKDVDFLKEIKQKVKGKNHFFITVPAFNTLWSGHDIYLGHYRRYTLKTLCQCLESAGFHITNAYYLYPSIFPLVYILRKLRGMRSHQSDMKAVSPLVNLLLKSFISLEMLVARINRLFGLTCVAEGFVEEPFS